MTVDEFERQAYHTVQKFSFIKAITTVDKTTNTIKLRLHIASDCFVQVYANTLKGLLSYALILNRSRLYGRDCEGGMWHRHPYDHSDNHDFGPEGSKAVTLDEFLAEVQDILSKEGLL
ncbi:MAG: hypothetical protein NUW24_01905 [Anaerolineae bacterium]|jgi:hypothetical protein|nr:hypothetical protein [Anaerolineae bacterium]MDH7473156.1 hypothetical protein [Anaerolineae bacterium]